eukprot:Sspe_Gene.42617::Locus_20708_Transcript_1_6_Confidence_0.667_Length_774::g.42617::m.42617/K20783/RRA; arabinosyltransferase
MLSSPLLLSRLLMESCIFSQTNRWEAVHRLLREGVGVLLLDSTVDVVLDPFLYLYADSDVEILSHGKDDASAYGYDHVVDDAEMGWSRYVHGTRLALADTRVVFLQATNEASIVSSKLMRAGLQSRKHEDALITRLLFAPSHEKYVSTG